jgi:hypothetical protein
LLLGIFLHHPHPSTAEDGLDFGSGFLPLMKIFHHLLKAREVLTTIRQQVKQNILLGDVHESLTAVIARQFAHVILSSPSSSCHFASHGVHATWFGS